MLRILESPPQLVEHCSTPKHTAATTVEMNVFDIADISKRLTFLITKDHFDDEETWTKSVWALRRAFGDAGWPLAEKISYADDKNRLAGVWKRDDASKARINVPMRNTDPPFNAFVNRLLINFNPSSAAILMFHN